MTLTRSLCTAAGLAASLLLASQATALQLTLSGDERLNIFGSGLPGTPYNTPVGGVDYDGVGSGDPHEGEVHITGNLPQLNYHTTGDPGTNVAFNFGPALDFTLEAELSNITLNPLGGTNVQIVMEFSGTADGMADLVISDSGDVVVRADLVAGVLNGNPVEALTAVSGSVDLAAPPENIVLQTFAFFQIRSGSAYASLFDDGLGSLNNSISTGIVTNFDTGDADPEFDFDDMVNEVAASNPLPSNTATAQGAVWAVSSSTFVVPEPGTGVLLGLGLLGVATRRRRS